MWPFIKPFWFRALLATLITIPIGSLDAVIALALKPFMDTVIMEQGGSTPFDLPLYVIPVFIVVFTILQAALEYTAAYLNTWTGGKITQELQKKLYRKLLAVDQSYLDSTSSGMVLTRFNGDANTACAGLLANVKVFTTRLFSSIALIGVLLYTSWQLAVIAIFVLGFSLYPLTQIRKKIKDVVAKSIVVGSNALTAYTETYAGMKTIASYNLQNYQRDRFFDLLTQGFKLGIKNTQRTAWLSPMMHIIISIGMAGTIWYGSYLITHKIITTGDFVSFMVAMLMLYTPIKNIGKNFNQVQLSFMAIDRVFEILDMPIVVKNKDNAIQLPTIEKDIVFENVHFAYKPDTPVLKNINLHVKKGQKIAFVGNSGGGKSTVVNLIPRFYEIGEGSIKIDGQDIRDVTLESLRQNIGVVFQDNFLFTGTIRDNLMLGKFDATDEEIHKALKAACLEDFIAELDKGLDTHIGERGTLLSGGQKQRIAIARAFLKNAPILILDEATSALDNKSEAVVQKAIDNLMQDRTVFVIAHRLSTIQTVDKIVVINEGEIIETGTHDELLSKNGAYNALYMAQFKGDKK
ncbi:MAG: ABC transporter ATP-binding protein [Alphaproteobacteria bacterium]|nr:ABC transporter ATP-binding protein [Alphaproteobacteria bacterium]